MSYAVYRTDDQTSVNNPAVLVQTFETLLEANEFAAITQNQVIMILGYMQAAVGKEPSGCFINTYNRPAGDPTISVARVSTKYTVQEIS